MIVTKFGGSSVANATNIALVLDIVQQKTEKQQIVVVVSAFSGVTDLLLLSSKKASQKNTDYKTLVTEIEEKHIVAIKQLIAPISQNDVILVVQNNIELLKTLLDGCCLLGELTPRTSDAIVSFGEILSSNIIAVALQQYQDSTVCKNSRELIKTNNNFGNAAVDFAVTNQLIKTYFNQNKNQITVVPGFVASSSDGNYTTLGRGGSDYTAAIFAAALHVSELEIWTDVSGMFTANPKIVKQAKPIEFISYQEAMELSHFGAKVLYPPTIQPVLKLEIPIVIKNTFAPADAGTIISNKNFKVDNPIKGISHIDKIALLTIEGSGMIGVSGSSKRLFEVLSLCKINVVFITQASSEHSICVGISNIEADQAKTAIDAAFELEISQQKIEPCVIEKNLCIVALVGENMKNHQGLSGKMFSTLCKNNVNIRAIAQGASERNISVVINEVDVKKALNSLHECFFEDNIKQLNLFVVGAGNVGQKFLEQIDTQRKFLKENLQINIRVAGLSNSRKMIFDQDGISLKNWRTIIETGAEANLQQFIDQTKKLNLRNSIFVDISADYNVSQVYAQMLEKSIAVVTCNKIACSSSFENYQNLKNLSRKFNAPFLFETNVGAGLPVIDTLKNLIASGDKIKSINAVLSGSLNFIFNNFCNSYSFHDVVKEAGVQGFTEPDPKIDLSGVDVARKILILIRESGYQMEMEDIQNNSFLPSACMQTADNDSFFESLITHSSHFENLLKQANQKDCRLKFVATFEDGKASVGLKFIGRDSPFYNLEGKDNIVQFYTDRYADQPLLIKGAGAGAAVTAAGIFSDVIRVGNS
jgi:aspartokinase/homoserine dehydrogenase 1